MTKNKNLNIEIPKNVINTIEKLEENDYEAFIVGGCVRDLLLGKEPNDWDITNNATPEEMLKIFTDGKYENNFGTMILAIRDKDDELEDVLEITTYRSEQGYSDRRRPDEVTFEKDIDRDLGRRDFTINAMAAKPKTSKIKIKEELSEHIHEEDGLLIVDLFGGVKDLKKKVIRAVGEPMDRFKEDALRMMRAIRFSGQLGFEIEQKTERAVLKMAGSIKFIAKERIAIELVKMMQSDHAYEAVMKMHDTKLLQYVLPELLQGVGVKQSHHHIHTVFHHSIYSLKHCPSKDWVVRFASLLHDVGKPKTHVVRDGINTFYNHEYVGAKIARNICKRLRFSGNDSDRIVNLVKNHMFYYNTDEVTAASVRRLVKKVGRENLKDLMDVRVADRLGSDVKKAMPYKLRHLEYMMEKVQNDPVSVKMLKINGDDIIKLLNIEPSRKIGTILDCLLAEVIEDPELNNKEFLEKKAKELNELDGDDLREKAKEAIEEKREEDDRKMRRGHKVK